MASSSTARLGRRVVRVLRGRRGGEKLAVGGLRRVVRDGNDVANVMYCRRGGRVRMCAKKIVRRREELQDKVSGAATDDGDGASAARESVMNTLANACVRAMLSEDNEAIIDLQMKLDEMHADPGGDGLLARALSSLLSNRVPDTSVLESLPPAHDVALRVVYGIVEDSGWNIEQVNAHAGQTRPNVSDLSDELFQPPPVML